MKKRSFLLKSLIGLFVGFTMVGCEGKSEMIDSYPMLPVTTYSNGDAKTVMSYNENGDVSQYRYFVNDSLLSKSDVKITSGGLICTVDSVTYLIELARALRVSSIEARVGGAFWYRIIYYYYQSNNLLQTALLERAGVKDQSTIVYYYNESSIIINEDGVEYELALSSNENTGNVCSVLSYSDAPLTTNYVINPNLYFLNIYGAPIPNLPSGQTIKRQNNQLTRVGKFYYGY